MREMSPFWVQNQHLKFSLNLLIRFFDKLYLMKALRSGQKWLFLIFNEILIMPKVVLFNFSLNLCLRFYWDYAWWHFYIYTYTYIYIYIYIYICICFLFYFYCVTHTHTGFSVRYIYIYTLKSQFSTFSRIILIFLVKLENVNKDGTELPRKQIWRLN